MSNLTDLRTLCIEELRFSVRLYNALKRHGIHDIGDLVELSERELAALPHLTMREVDEAKDKLRLINEQCGTDLHLAADAEEPDFYEPSCD